MKKKYTVYGPVSDESQFEEWYQVLGPRGGIKSEWYTKTAAKCEAERLNREVKNESV
jgi:hypothetical protein